MAPRLGDILPRLEQRGFSNTICSRAVSSEDDAVEKFTSASDCLRGR